MIEQFKPDGARSYVEGSGKNTIYHVGTLTYTKVCPGCLVLLAALGRLLLHADGGGHAQSHATEVPGTMKPEQPMRNWG